MKIFNKKETKELRQELRNNLTKSEKILWSKIKGKNISDTRFRRQYGIGNYVVDFYCPELKLAIEIDGESHFQEDSYYKDSVRTKFIENEGVHLIRFTNNDIQNSLDSVLNEINREIVLLREQRLNRKPPLTPP